MLAQLDLGHFYEKKYNLSNLVKMGKYLLVGSDLWYIFDPKECRSWYFWDFYMHFHSFSFTFDPLWDDKSIYYTAFKNCS